MCQCCVGGCPLLFFGVCSDGIKLMMLGEHLMRKLPNLSGNRQYTFVVGFTGWFPVGKSWQ